MKQRKQVKVLRDESRLFYGALFCLASVFLAYIYFVSQSVVHVVMRKEVDTQIASLSTHVAELESEYIEMQHKVSNDIASLQGFVVADKKIFIDKTAATLVLSR